MISPIQPSFNQPSFKSLDTKEKIVLSTPLLATVSAMNETGLSSKTSQILTNGGRAFAKWTCGLLAAGTIISANKFLARNSKTVRDFEEKHDVWTIIGAGAVGTGVYHGFKAAAKGFANTKKDSFNEISKFVEKIDDVNVINGLKDYCKELKGDYKSFIRNCPNVVQKINRGLGNSSKYVMKHLPKFAIATACGLAMITPKIMPKN